MVDVQWTMVERRTSGRDSLVVLWSLLGRRLQLVPYGEELDRAKEMVTVYTEGGDVVQRRCTVPRKPGLEKDEWERQLREVEILQMQDDSEWARSSLWKRRNEVSGFTNSKGRGALFHTHLPPSKVSVDMQVCDRDLESLREQGTFGEIGPRQLLGL